MMTHRKYYELVSLNKRIRHDLSRCYQILKLADIEIASLWNTYGRQTVTSHVNECKDSDDEMSLAQAISTIKKNVKFYQ